MKKYKNKKKLIISIMLLISLVIGIGYAYLTSNLSISGQTEVVKNTWNIHFENLIVSDGSVTASTPATIDNNYTIINYGVILSRPGDYYEFTVDIKNDGSVSGKVNTSTLSGLTADAEKVIDYSIKYIDETPVSINDIIMPNTKKTIKVRIYYKKDIENDEIPSSNLNLSLTYSIQFVQGKKPMDINKRINQLMYSYPDCFTKYEGEVTDEAGNTKMASNVYINKCYTTGVFNFGGFCWRLIRTTESGGAKLLYNGESKNGRCYDIPSHKGPTSTSNSSMSISSMTGDYLYGELFTYDQNNSTFTLKNTFTTNISNESADTLIGKYTCITTSDTCSTIYYIHSISQSSVFYTSYTVSSIVPFYMGYSSFNSTSTSPSMVGYMFNKTNNNISSGTPASNALAGNDVSYSNGTYTLLPADGETELSTSLDNNHRYTCNNTTGTCSSVRYYYQISDYSTYNYYIILNGSENISEELNSLINNDNVNKYNSAIKGVLDSWYAQHLDKYTSKIEDVVYCNPRDIRDYSGWNPNNDINGSYLYFSDSSNNKSLVCNNITDQFSISNNKAKLIYPVGLPTSAEVRNNGDNSFYRTYYANENELWILTPTYYHNNNAYLQYLYDGNIISNGNINSKIASSKEGIRPVISLKSNNIIVDGAGTEYSPFVID